LALQSVVDLQHRKEINELKHTQDSLIEKYAYKDSVHYDKCAFVLRDGIEPETRLW